MKNMLIFTALMLTSSLYAEEPLRLDVPMHNQGASTYYVESTIQGSDACMMLVDTGSGHSVINEVTLAKLKANGKASFIKNLQGMMADGSTKIVPLYRVSAITIGENCLIRDVEAAVLPNNTRQILGISTLQRAAPFGLSFNPPMLTLSGCEDVKVLQAANDAESTDIKLEAEKTLSSPEAPPTSDRPGIVVSNAS